ncbi:hypothetical protein P43SY_011794 [Pythium insidiosum]|uniref:Peptidase C1A papain C-terminal domain-containing protein n=1 Tax=Pythium insidiosum TaxID=114742 RepID=A0AAD5LPM5_PYTIN|nr:hypothetical protein P43SY_011794 [Pythium insidiosum]
MRPSSQPTPGTSKPSTQPQPKPQPTTRPNPGPKPGPGPSPVGPVAPDLPDDGNTTPAPAPETGGDGSGLDWSTKKCMPPIQNQGACGSCWAFAGVSVAESAMCIRQGGNNLVKLSEQNVASCSTRNSGCSGGVPVWTFEHIQQQGICKAEEDPYTSGNGRLAASSSCCRR